jgi:hypothetical protein
MNIEKIVVGIDNLQNIQENINALNENVSQKTFVKLNLLTESNEDILLPFKWKK